MIHDSLNSHVVVSVSIDFPINSKQYALFIKCLMTIPCERVLVGIDVDIPHRNYQDKPHSIPWFSAACTAAIIHRNHALVSTNRIDLLNLKESSDRLVIVTKGFLELANLHMLLKQKILFPETWRLLETSGRLLVVFSLKVNLL